MLGPSHRLFYFIINERYGPVQFIILVFSLNFSAYLHKVVHISFIRLNRSLVFGIICKYFIIEN